MDNGQLAPVILCCTTWRRMGNSGATFAVSPAPRGPDTFRRTGDHPRGKAVVELAVDYAVSDAADLTGRVGRWRGGEELEEVWRKG